MKIILQFVILTLGLAFLSSCTKEEGETSTSENVFAGDFTYFMIDTIIKKSADSSSSVGFRKVAYNSFGAVSSSISSNSGIIYRGNFQGMTAYDEMTGNILWTKSYGVGSVNGVTALFKVIFIGENAYFASNTSGLGFSRIYCVNKRTGAAIWNKQIDFSLNFANPLISNPVAAGDKILITGKGSISNALKIYCFNASDGTIVWQSAEDAQLSTNLEQSNGRVFSSGKFIKSYDVNNGTLLWSKDLTITGSLFEADVATYADNNKIIFVRQESNGAATSVRVFDQSSGSIEKQFFIPIMSQGLRTVYRNEILYLITISDATQTVVAYNVFSGIKKWGYKTPLLPGLTYFDYSAPIVTPENLIVMEQKSYGSMRSNNFKVFDLNGALIKEVNIKEFSVPQFIFRQNNITYTMDEN